MIACSALKRGYRDVLINGRGDVRLVYLKGGPELIARRLSLREEHHFMPAALLDSQFATLEEPADDEHPIVVPIDARHHDIVDAIVAKLGIAPRGQGRGVASEAASNTSSRPSA